METLLHQPESSTYRIKPGPRPSGSSPIIPPLANPAPTVHRGPAIPSGYVPTICCQCECGIVVPAGAANPLCRMCALGNAENACHLISCQIRDLVRGDGEFAALSARERNIQLAAIGTALKAKVSLRVAPDVAQRIAVRISQDEPTPSERDEIESRLEAEEEDDRRTAMQRPDPHDIW